MREIDAEQTEESELLQRRTSVRKQQNSNACDQGICTTNALTPHARIPKHAMANCTHKKMQDHQNDLLRTLSQWMLNHAHYCGLANNQSHC